VLARQALGSGDVAEVGALLAARRALSEEDASSALSALRSVLELPDRPRRAA
jgi:hypothetical protein